MKLAAPICLAALMFGSCAQSLEQIVEEHHEARLEAANANKPLTKGAADGLGSGIGDTAPHMTMEAAKQQNP